MGVNYKYFLVFKEYCHYFITFRVCSVSLFIYRCNAICPGIVESESLLERVDDEGNCDKVCGIRDLYKKI